MKNTFFFIPHTHWEGAVFKTREAYLEMGLPNILRALRLLKANLAYRFVLDQACYVKPFLERYPEEGPAFRQAIAEGRLAIVGGMDVMPDVNMPGGESFVRQVLYGKTFFRQSLGLDVTNGWLLDTFGHHPQMPQLLKLAGYDSFWFFRGVPDWDTPSEFDWQGIDGSRIPAFWLPFGYALTYGSPADPDQFAVFMQQAYDSLSPFAPGPARVGLAGADVCEPEEHIPALVEAYNRQSEHPFDLKIGLPGDYEKAVKAQIAVPERRIIESDLNPIFQGAYSSRIELKQAVREIENRLITAEKLGVLLGWAGVVADDGPIARAWEPLLFNQTHDLMSGVMTDAVYSDTVQSYAFSRRLAEQETQSRLRALTGLIDTRGEGVPLVVFNPLGWSRTDAVTASVGFSQEGVMDLEVIDPQGRAVPVQMMESECFASGGLLQARFVFIAKDIPALGYAVYRVIGQKTRTEPPATLAEKGEPVLDNDLYHFEFDPGTGAITKLVDKQAGWSVFSSPGNVIAMEEDRGDFWEPYHALDGGSRIAMRERHLPPQSGQAVFSTDQPGSGHRVVRGPVFSEYTVAHPFADAGQFQTTVRLYANLRRIEISTRLFNQNRFVRYRALFPTEFRSGLITREIPFGAVAQPDGVEFPAQNWADLSQGGKGLALLNRGLPGNNAADGTLMLSLLRSTCIVAYGFGGGYEPGMSSESGFDQGKELTFDYALVPHQGTWQDARIFRDGLEFNHPLIAVTASSQAGSLPPCWAAVEINQPDLVVSAVKAGRDGNVILRLYEAAGRPVSGAEIRLPRQVTFASEVNLMEDPIRALELKDNRLILDFHPFEIKTLSLASN